MREAGAGLAWNGLLKVALIKKSLQITVTMLKVESNLMVGLHLLMRSASFNRHGGHARRTQKLSHIMRFIFTRGGIPDTRDDRNAHTHIYR